MTPAEKILRKRLVAAGLSSADWDRVAAGLRDRAFFSARVESVRHLQAAQQGLAGLLRNARNADGAIVSRAQVVSDLMRSARELGIATGKGGIADPGSSKRAALVVDTNRDLALGYVRRVEGSTPGARLAFPAWELVRIEAREQERDWRARWKAAGGETRGGRMVALKDDGIWSRLSRFGQPYPPFDFGSGMGVEDVSHADCVALGLVSEDWAPAADSDPVRDFNAGLEAELEFKGADDPGWKFLRESFGDQVKYDGGKVKWQADLIMDLFKGRMDGTVATGAVRLGRPTPELLSVAARVEGAAGQVSGKQLTMPVDQFAHEARRHIGKAETDPRNLPLEESELSLVPHVWRRPDRAARDKSGAIFFDKQAADGGWYRLVVDPHANGIVPKTFYKMKAGASGLPS